MNKNLSGLFQIGFLVSVIGIVSLLSNPSQSIIQLGAFGDFIGGTLSVLFSFLGVVFIIKEFKRNTRLENLTFKVSLISRVSHRIREGFSLIEIRIPRVSGEKVEDNVFSGIRALETKDFRLKKILLDQKFKSKILEFNYIFDLVKDPSFTISQKKDLIKLVQLELGDIIETFDFDEPELSMYNEVLISYRNLLIQAFPVS